MKYYLDTNIIIYALKNQYPLIWKHLAAVPSQSVVIPEIVIAEIEYGAQKSRSYEETISVYRQFTDTFVRTQFSGKAVIQYGIIRAALEKAGTPIGPNDLMIAATVLADDGILVTKNTGEFSRIPGLRLEDWTV